MDNNNWKDWSCPFGLNSGNGCLLCCALNFYISHVNMFSIDIKWSKSRSCERNFAYVSNKQIFDMKNMLLVVVWIYHVTCIWYIKCLRLRNMRPFRIEKFEIKNRTNDWKECKQESNFTHTSVSVQCEIV